MPHISMRVARPTQDLERVRSFYEHVIGLPVLWSFVDHDGFDGVIFGVPDERAQLELVRSPTATPRPRPPKTPSCSTATAARPPPASSVASNEETCPGGQVPPDRTQVVLTSAAEGFYGNCAGAGRLRHGPAGWAPRGVAVSIRAPIRAGPGGPRTGAPRRHRRSWLGRGVSTGSLFAAGGPEGAQPLEGLRGREQSGPTALDPTAVG
jgi:hypothetical protein